ncbi:MAG: tryptophan synthase subunit alpha [Gammaproteobacteria bacterium]
MSRIAQRFDSLKKQGRTALIPYITAGDPQPDVTVPLLHALVDAGADLLEIGVPFSDPMADGPVIQAACERALKHKIGMRHVLDMVTEFRQQDQETPIILMGYLNPIEVMGYAEFAVAANAAGVDGVITVDLPPEEATDFCAELTGRQLDPIFLAAPTSDDERIKRMVSLGGGFLYYVSFKGVTGANRLDVTAVANKLKQIRACTSLPIAVGFGIRDAESAAQVAGVADAVVVGSALVGRMAELADEPENISSKAPVIIAAMRNAMDQCTC